MEAKRKQEEEERKKREDEEKRIQVCAHGAAAESLSEWNYRLMKQRGANTTLICWAGCPRLISDGRRLLQWLRGDLGARKVS